MQASKQLLERLEPWVQTATRVLSRPGHGVPSVRQIMQAGRRVQDEANLAEQIAAEQEKVAAQTREPITVEMVREDARSAELSNDRVMRLGEERLKFRVRLTEMSVQKFWKELVIPEGERPYRHVMRVGWKSFPLLHRMVFRKKGASIAELVSKLRAVKMLRRSRGQGSANIDVEKW